MKNSILMLLTVALCSCHQMNSEKALSEEVVAESETLNSPNATSGVVLEKTEKLIRTAHYRFQVTSVRKSIDKIESSVEKFPAQVAGSALTFEGSTIESRMTIRVRSEFFDELLKEIDREAFYVHYRNVRSEDVGKQFVDLESRLKTKREVQERFKEILRTKAGKIEELLSAERQIGELQEEIEATVSKLNFLRDQVAYSTINLEMYERINEELIASEETPLWKQFRDAFSQGLNGAISVLISLTTLWPLLLIVLVALVLKKKFRKRLTA